MKLDLTSFIARCRQRVDSALDGLLPASIEGEHNLQAAMRYSLFNGGKRIRPVLAYASGLAITDIEDAKGQGNLDRVACALESIHAYSLIHDDLPAMDDDDLRRGKPTCHIMYGEATAILAGDALQAFAFELLSEAPDLSAATRIALLQRLARSSGKQGMVLGQAIDLAAVNHHLNLEQLETMHRYKTGALIRASVAMGAIACDADTGQLLALDDYAAAIGLAFQVQDDILDVTADTETLGKQQGADIARNKPTYVSLLGLEVAQAKARELHEQALAALAGFDHKADILRSLSAYIIERRH